MVSNIPPLPPFNRHRDLAELAIQAGERAVAKIEDLAQQRQEARESIGGVVERVDTIRALTKEMDEQGKKAHGCWLQAIAHGLLAR